jgi:HlyD family secretion protein
VVWIALPVLLAAGGFVGYRTLLSGDEEPVRYRTAVVSHGDVEKAVTATGTLSPLVTVTVGSQVTGRIHEIFVDFNSRVRKGQVIARIDPRLYKTEVANTRANLAAARANLRKAEAAAREAKLQYERDRGLSAQKVVAPAEVETRLATYQSAEAQVVAARASVEQAKAALSRAQTNLAYTTIVSPIDGVVVSRSVDVGQTVAASLQAPTLFTIAEDLRKMEVHTSVAESDVGQLTVGMETRFTVDAFSNETFNGLVKQVRYEAQTVQNVVTYDAVVSVDNRELKLRPGMTANVTFVVERRKNVLRVPTAALRFRPPEKVRRQPKRRSAAKKHPGGKGRPARSPGRLIWILRAGAPVPARVETGISDGSHSEVLEGDLREGDRVIVGLEEEREGGRRGGSARPKRRRRFF